MEELLRLEHVSKTFTLRGKRTVQALHDVSFTLYRGEALGVVGESGCGKSTLARVIMGVYPSAEGALYLHGAPLDLRRRKARLDFARQVQMVFQDPYSALNPRHKVGQIVAENLVIHGHLPPRERRERVGRLLEAVGLPAACADRFPDAFSGGQRQRIGIARALALHPQLLICDEPISALDVSIQGQIMNLLRGLGRDLGLSYLFIAHDLGMVGYLCDRVLVMYRGHIVELAQADALQHDPLHPYTQLLTRSALKPDPAGRVTAQEPVDQAPLLSGAGAGCPFADRCPRAQARCMVERPLLRPISPGHEAACHLL